jgi:hypothetical protein
VPWLQEDGQVRLVGSASMDGIVSQFQFFLSTLRWEDCVMEDARKLGGEKLGGMLQRIGTAGRSF